MIHKLSLREYTESLRQIASALAAPPEDFIQLWFATINERGMGVFQSYEENFRYICDKLGINAEDSLIEQAVRPHFNYTADSIRVRPHAVEVLSHLKSNGYKTGLITDCAAFIPRIYNDMPIAPFLDVAIFSCSVGMLKPDPRIYLMATGRLEVKPGECLYIGDGDDNELTGALKVGMQPVLIRNPDEDSDDVHHTGCEAEAWEGPVISSLQDVLNLLE